MPPAKIEHSRGAMMFEGRKVKSALRIIVVAALWLAWAATASAQHEKSNAPIQVKVVVVAMFERGEDTGDVPGEYQYWVEREHLDQILPMSAGYHHIRMN